MPQASALENMEISSASGHQLVPSSSSAGLSQPEFQVDAGGQATIRIPLELPPGVAGMTPKLELSYGSSQGNGIMGVGWSCNGMSAIARIKATYASDGFNGAVRYDSNDRYSLDGQRLIVVEGEYGKPGTVYYTELQNWSYVKEIDGGFSVVKKDGETLEYGTTLDSRIVAAGTDHARIWALHSVSDRNGNRIEYFYKQGESPEDPGAYYPDRIVYTVRDDMQPARFVQFHYEPRPDTVVSYVGGFPVILSKRLSEITTSLTMTDGIERIRSYQIHYETSNATQLSRVVSIGVSGAASQQTPDYVAATILWSDTAQPGLQTNGPTSSLNQPGAPQLLPMDVSGSGRTDVVHLWRNDQVLQASVYLATPGANGIKYVWASDTLLDSFPKTFQVLPADVNGDGRTDLLVAFQNPITHVLNLAVYLSTGQGFEEAPGSPYNTGDPWDPATHLKFFAMDVNGDGRTDLVQAYSQNNQLCFRSYLSDFGSGSGFSSAIVSTTDDPANPPNVSAFWAMDVNGDGMMDLVRVWRGADSTVHITSYVSVSTAIDQVSFASRVDSNVGAFSLDKHAFLPIDVNGDGIQDLLHIWQDAAGTTLHLTTFLCDASSGFVQGPDSVFTNQTIDLAKLLPIGLNGGGQVSLLSPWTDTEGLLHFSIFQGSPSGQFRLLPPTPPIAANPDSFFFGGDPDGNGKADLIQVYLDQNRIPLLVPLLSTGPCNDLLLSITNSLGGIVSLEYLPITDAQVYEPEQESVFPEVPGRRFPNPLTPTQFPAQSVLGQAVYVVQSATKTNVAKLNRYSYTSQSTYAYAGARIDMLGRGWQGFKTVRTTSLDSGKATTQTYNQDFPLTGFLAQTTIEADGRYTSDPRVPKGQNVLLRRVDFEYVISQPNQKQPVVQVLPSLSRIAEFDYGSDRPDYELAQTFAYDAFGNLTWHSNLGYVTPGTLQPLYEDEVVYRHNLYQNDILLDGGWVLGLLLYAKVSDHVNDPDVTKFLPGDLRLEQQTFASSSYNLASKASWDDTNNVFLTTAYTYDSYGNRIAETGPSGSVTTTEYDLQYQTFKMKVTLPPTNDGAALTTSYGYDPRFGVEVARRDPNGSVFIRGLDGFGRVVSSQGPVPSATVSSDPSQLTALVTGSSDLRKIFQDASVLTLETTAYLNDDSGGLYREVASLQSFPDSSARDFVWKRSYIDGLTLERETIRQTGQSAGNALVLTNYNADGKPVQQSLPFFSTDSTDYSAAIFALISYDVLGRPIQRQDPAGAQGQQYSVTTWSYGQGGRVTITQAAGSSAAYVQVQEHHFYDSQDKVRRTIVPADGDATSLFQFDRLARLVGTTDPPTLSNPAGVSNTTVYDSLDRQRMMDNPDQNTTSNPEIKAIRYEYDPVTGNLSRQTDASLAIILFSYDAIGRLVKQSLSDGTTVHLVYDAGAPENIGHMTQATLEGPDHTISSRYTHSYDRYGNNVGTELFLSGEPASFLTSSLFDPQRRIVQQTLPDRSVIHRGYAYSQLTQIDLAGASVSKTQVSLPLDSYHPTGAPSRLIYGKGAVDGGAVVADFTFNPSGQLYNEIVSNSEGTVLSEAYEYDLLSQILHIGKDGPAPKSFTYANQRLTAATTPGFAPATYEYDASSNLTQKEQVQFSFHAHFAFRGTNKGVEVYSATADACGRTNKRTADGVTQSFEYDSLGFLRRVISSSGATVSEMLNDYRGRRLRQINNNGTTAVYVSPEYEVTRAPDGSTSVTLSLRDGRGPLASVSTGAETETQYLRRDHKGNITHVFNSAGILSTTIGYSGYGEFVLLQGSSAPATLYESRGWNKGANLYYFGARYYDPLTGRFLTPDNQPGGLELTQAGVFNRYAFELNNPIRYVDPTGHWAAWKWGLVVGLAILAIGVIVVSCGTAVPVVAFLGVSASTAALGTSIIGGALVAAGISATAYAASHPNDSFSWKDWGIQTAIGGAIGGVTGGIFYGVGLATAGLRTSVGLFANVLAGSFVGSAGDVLGQFLINAAEGNSLTSGLAAAALFGGIFGGLGAGIGFGAGRIEAKVAQRIVDAEEPGMLAQLRRANERDFAAFAERAAQDVGSYTSLPRPVDELAQVWRQARLESLMNGVIQRALLQSVTTLSTFPEAFTEDETWKWSS